MKRFISKFLVISMLVQVFQAAVPAFAQDTQAEYGDKFTMVNMATDCVISGVYSYTYEDGTGNGIIESTEKDSSGNIIAVTPAVNYEEKAVAAYTDWFKRAFVGDNETPVDRILINSNYCRDLTGSEVVDSAEYDLEYDENGDPLKDSEGNVIKTETTYPANNWFYRCKVLNLAGIDWFGYAVEGAHANNIEAWASLRMNDSHYLGNAGVAPGFSTSTDSRHLSGNKRMNYADASVRNYWKNYIVDLCTRYDIDGVDLDFLRDVCYFDSVNNETRALMSNWLKDEVRPAVNAVVAADEAERPDFTRTKIEISARVYPTEEKSLAIGLDGAQWAADGSIDILALSGYDNISMGYPISAWRESIAAKNGSTDCKIVVGGSNYVTTSNYKYNTYSMFLYPETIMGMASSAYYDGADGIYTFNTYAYQDCFGATVSPEGVTTNYSGSYDRLLNKYKAMVPGDVEKGLRSYVLTNEQMTYPYSLNNSNPLTVSMNTAHKPTAGYYTVLIGMDNNTGYYDDNIAVSVNGTQATQIRDIPTDPTFTFSEGGSGYRPRHLSQAAPRFAQYSVPISAVSDGYNGVTISNSSETNAQTIMWIQINVDAQEGAEPEQSAYQFNKPSGLKAIRTEGSSYPVLTWENVGANAGVEVYRKASSENDFSLIATLDADSAEYTDTSADASTAYSYKLKYVPTYEGAQTIFTAIAAVTRESSDFEFIGKDETTIGAWEGKYGSEGYMLLGYAKDAYGTYGTSMKLNAYTKGMTGEQTSLMIAPSFVDSVKFKSLSGRASANSSGTYALDKPAFAEDQTKHMVLSANDGIRSSSSATSGDLIDQNVEFVLNDNNEHIFTAYFAELSTSNVTELPIYIKNLNNEVLAGTVINPSNYSKGGVYLRFKVKGSFILSFPQKLYAEVKQGARYGFSGFFFDKLILPEESFENVAAQNMNIQTYNTAVEGKYAYSIKDAKTIEMTNLETGIVEKTYTEENANTSFALQLLNDQASDEYISVGNGIVCVACASYDNEGKAESKKNVVRLIDFTKDVPTAQYFKFCGNIGDIIKIYKSYLYAANGAESIYIYKVATLLEKQDEGNLASVPTENKCSDRMIGHLYMGTEKVDAKKVNGRPASLLIDWDENGTGTVIITTKYNSGNSNPSEAVAQIYFNNGNPVISKAKAVIHRSEITEATSVNTFYTISAAEDGTKLYMVNNGAYENSYVTDDDNGLIIYDYSVANSANGYASEYINTIKSKEYKTLCVGLYNDYIIVGGSDSKLHVYDKSNYKEVTSYSLNAVPKRISKAEGYLYIQTEDGLYILSENDIQIKNLLFKTGERVEYSEEDKLEYHALNSYKSSVSGNYVYSIKDAQNVVRTDITSGDTVTYTADDVYFATDFVNDRNNFLKNDETNAREVSGRYITSEGNIACVAVSKYADTVSGFVNACVLIDFSGETPVAKTVDLGTNDGRVNYVLSGGYLFYTIGNQLYVYDLQKLMSGLTPEEAKVGYVNSISSGNGPCSVNIEWNEDENSGRILTAGTGWNGSYASATKVEIRPFTVSNGEFEIETIEVSLSAEQIISNALGNGTTQFQSFRVSTDNGKLYVLNNAGGANNNTSNTFVAIYDISSSEPAFIRSITSGSTENMFYDYAVVDGNVVIGASDGTLKVYDVNTGACTKTYNAQGAVRGISTSGSVICLQSGLTGFEVIDKSWLNYTGTSISTVSVYADIYNRTYKNDALDGYLAIYSGDSNMQLKSVTAEPITVSLSNSNNSVQHLLIENIVQNCDLSNMATSAFFWRGMNPVINRLELSGDNTVSEESLRGVVMVK